MKDILASEGLKIKSVSYYGLLFLIPFLANFVAFILAGPAILESFSIFWWESFFILALVNLLVLYDRKNEEKAGSFQNVKIGPHSYQIVLAKFLLTFRSIILSSFLFMGFLYLISLLYVGYFYLSIWQDMFTLLLLNVAILWMIPFLYLLSSWVNVYLLLGLNIFMGFLVSPFLAQTSFWYFIPHTYVYKLGQVLLHINPSGDLELGQVVSSIYSVPIILILSVSLFLIFLRIIKKRVKTLW